MLNDLFVRISKIVQSKDDSPPWGFWTAWVTSTKV